MENNNVNDPLGILSKKDTPNNDPLGILKKKVETTPTQSNLPSASEGGTSGLTATPSASLSTPTETYTVKPGTSFDPFATPPKQVSEQTALGNKLTPSTEMKSVTTGTKGEAIVPDSKIISNNIKQQRDTETKALVDKYEKYKQDKSIVQKAQGKQPFASDDNKNTIDFYMSYLKENDPEEYNYTLQKQASLSKDKEGKVDLEDIQEDDLMIQKFQAETLQKALGLKSRIMSGKYDMASNALKDNYGDLIKDINSKQTKLTDVEAKIKEIDSNLESNFQKNEAGQIITTPQNRKTAEDLINRRNELINEYTGYQEEIKGASQNEDFMDAMTLLDETEKTYNSMESMYRGFVEKNPDVLKGLPEYKKQVEKEKEAKRMKDFSEVMTGGDLGIGEAIGRGATSIVSALSFIPKNFSSNPDYGWTDKLYDVVKSNIDDFDAEYNPLPSGYDKPVKDSKTGEWNLKYLPGKIAGTVTEMAPIIAITALTEGATAGLLARAGASGELGTALGAFAGEYVAVADDFYSEAKAAGMSERDAMSFSRGAATTQALFGALYPDIKLARAAAAKSSYKTYAENIAKGVSKKQAVKEAAKDFSEKLIKEIPQENLQTIQEIYDKNEMYGQMGLNEKIQKSVKDAVVETTILSSIVTLGFGAKGVRTPSRMQQESLFMAASQPEDIMKAAQTMLDNKQITEEQFEDVSIKVQKATVALSKIDKTLPAEKKAKLLVPLIEKLDLKEEASQLDDSQKEIMNEKIAAKDNELKQILSSQSDQEQEDALNEEDFLKSIQEEIDAKKQKKVEIPESENKMQQEGLFELDDTQKAQPIELSAKPENVIVPEAKAEVKEEVKPTETVAEQKPTAQSKNTVELPPLIEGGQTRKFELSNGKWMQNVGGELTAISPSLQTQVENKYNEQLKTEEVKTEEIVPPATEQVAATEVVPEKATSSPEVKTGSIGVIEDKSDAEIEKRMIEIEGSKPGTPELAEFNALEKEMEKRERASIFNIPLDKVNESVDALMQKEKDMPNGYGSFIDKKDARETKEVADRYLDAEKLTDAELKKDFKDSVMGNPDTWYADGLKLRESMRVATERGINTKELIAEIVKEFERDGYSKEDAINVIKRQLEPIFKDSKVIEKEAYSPEVKEIVEAPKAEMPTQTQEEVKQTTPTPKTKEQISAEQSISEEESQKEASNEDQATLKKMDDDVEVLKGYNKEKFANKTPAELKKLIEDKYVGVLARAYKAKMEGKIAGPTYTAYRNELNKMMEEKLRPFTKKAATGTEGDNIRKGELKAQVTALGERVKEKLLGEGYKNITLSVGMPGPTPEMIGKLVDLTVKGVNYAIDAGFSVREATSIAFSKIKSNPTYQRLVNEGNINEKEFEKEVYRQFSTAKAEPQPVAEPEVKKETKEKATEKEVEETQVEGMPVITQEDITSGKEGMRKQAKRRTQDESYEEINKLIPQEAAYYNKMNQDQIAETIKSYINELEATDMIMEAANIMLDEKAKKPMPAEVVHVFNLFLADRMKTLAKETDNSTLKQDLLNKAARLRENNDKNSTTIAKSLANLYIYTKEFQSSPEGVKAAAEQRQVNTIDTYLNKKQKTALESVAEPVNSLINSDMFKEEVAKATEQKLKEIAAQTKGKEWVNKVDAFDSLIEKTDDC